MNNSNTTFIFAVLVHSTGSIAFFPNSATFGEIAQCWVGQEVTYMPHFQLQDGDVLNHCGEEFNSFEELYKEYPFEDVLDQTFIFNN